MKLALEGRPPAGAATGMGAGIGGATGIRPCQPTLKLAFEGRPPAGAATAMGAGIGGAAGTGARQTREKLVSVFLYLS